MKLSNPEALPGWIAKARNLYVQDRLDLRRSIYRYMSATNILNTLDSGALFMSRVDLWTDPFEKWWCDQLLQDGSRLAGVNVYGSCWTRRSRDEPFWRLYEDRCGHCDAEGVPLSAAAPPVRMKLRLDRLVTHLASEIQHCEAKVFVGEVGYCKTAKMVAAAANLRSGSKEVACEVALGLHLKRAAFSFEREVRVLWIERGRPHESLLLNFPLAVLVDSFMIGPTLDVSGGKALKEELVTRGISRESVKRSLIYGSPRALLRR